jgi:hypothetical protein
MKIHQGCRLARAAIRGPSQQQHSSTSAPHKKNANLTELGEVGVFKYLSMI